MARRRGQSCGDQGAGPAIRSPYAVFDEFRAWVRANHPELFDVIWVDRTSALYTTPDGARAVLDLLDEYQPPG